MKEKDINQLVSQNLNYVKSLANQYRGHGLDFDDLASEGYMAMVQAAQKFDENRGTSFVAYAAPFIRKAMEQAIERQGNLYRIPKSERKNNPRSVDKAISMDAPLSMGNQYTLLDILVNQDSLQADEDTAFQQMLSDLYNCIKELAPREQEVIQKFFGLGHPHVTLAEIADEMSLKRERVRQIRNTAIRKIAKNAKTKTLKAFLRK